MNLHEYQAKSLFKDYGLPVSDGYAVDTADEAVEAATKIGGDRWVVKVQVHAGGRGKAGGVKLADSLDEVRAFADNWIGKNLVTFQTDEHGQPVSKIYVESCTDIDTELYLGAVVDRRLGLAHDVCERVVLRESWSLIEDRPGGAVSRKLLTRNIPVSHSVS